VGASVIAVDPSERCRSLWAVLVVRDARFNELVSEALDAIPDPLWDLMDNVAVFVEDAADDPTLLGLYEGIPLTERGEYGGLAMPDRITIYRLAICAICENEQDVVAEVGVTVVHEIAHHFGIEDDRLHELGWG
jgi:predicted Zn-dependent protease with MMP-like domain